MSALGIQFQKNLGEEKRRLEFSTSELEGLPGDFIAAAEKSSTGKISLDLKYPSYIPVMKLCKVESTRQQMEKAFNARCIEENTKILEELVELRAQSAKIMGYATHADFVTEIRMSKSASSVEKFLAQLSSKLTPLLEREIKVLLELKKKEKADRGEEFDGKINAWDKSYYCDMVEKEQYSVDQELFKPYFPLEVVTKGMLDIYQELLGLIFVQEDSLPTWHEDVMVFKVKDKATSEYVGLFYLDLHPREGKYGHAACWPLQPSCNFRDGRLKPVSACVCNFTKPTADKPSLLLHNEVETFFHEFGHCMHNICSLAEMQMFSGTSVERDFVEAPSQMLENWCWEKDALKRMSAHVETSEPLPDDLIDPLIKSRNANTGIFNKRQILLGTFDQTIHSSDSINTTATFAQMSIDIAGFATQDGTNMPASFGHLAGGYDAQYYGYLWSEVFSADMFQRFKQSGIFSPEVGADYRRFILQPGGSKDASDMIEGFLGRAPNDAAFLVSKGLTAKSAV